jgi:UDP-N-acetylmuramoyl-tripeptide--D-alanyl-D-alanine ligase
MKTLFDCKFTIDTRQTTGGEVFVALTGGQTDGHLYAKQALEAGASAVIVSRDLGLKNQIMCRNTLNFITDLARTKALFMREAGCKIIAITGSVGKTSTKEIIYQFIRHNTPKVAKTEGNYNNHIGLPLTILNAPTDNEFLILEMGMNNLGEISHLSSVACPYLSLITNVTDAHIGKLGSRENIAIAKSEIFDFTTDYAILNENDDFYDFISSELIKKGLKVCKINSKTQIENYEINNLSTKLTISGQEYELDGVFTQEWLACVAFATEITRILNLDVPPYIQTDFEGRGKVLSFGKAKIIDESYNASPESVKNALKTFSKYNGKKLVILGEMRELGDFSERLHLEIANHIDKNDTLVIVGKLAFSLFNQLSNKSKYFFERQEDIEIDIQGYDFVLIKGSHGVGLWRFLDRTSLKKT